MADTKAQETLALVKRWIAIGEAKDKAALMGMLTPNAIIELPFNESGVTREGFFRRYQGAEQLSVFFDNAFAAEVSVKMLDVDITISQDGNTAFVECFGDGVMTNGKTYQNRYVFRLDFEGGKVKRAREYYNPVTTAYAFGRPVAGKHVVDSLDAVAAAGMPNFAKS